MRENTRRNGKIEFLRFIFALMVVFSHSGSFMGEYTIFAGGSLGVEFFFFVSGFLMMATIEKLNQVSQPQNIGKETGQFIIKKWKLIFPEALITFLIGFVITALAENLTLREMVLWFIDTVWNVLFVTMTGLGRRGINPVVWYISAMLISMAILYPLLRKYRDMMLWIVIPLTSLCIFGYFYQNYGAPRSPTIWLGWTYKGVLRAFAELGIGCLLYYLSKYIRNIGFNKKGRYLITITETLLYLGVLTYMYVLDVSVCDYFFIVLLAAAVALTFSGIGIDAEFYNNKLAMWLGKFSIPLYLSHSFYATYFSFFVPEGISHGVKLLIYLGMSFATALMVMYVTKYVRKAANELFAGIKKAVTEG